MGEMIQRLSEAGCRPGLHLAKKQQISQTLSAPTAQITHLSCLPRSIKGAMCITTRSSSPPFTSTRSQQTKATLEAVVYHISNESWLIVCIPETAMIHCLALARDQPLNNVYHCLPGLFNYLATLLTKQQGSQCFMTLKPAAIAIVH